MIGETWIMMGNQPPMNSVQNKPNVLGVYHISGSMRGPGDTEKIPEVADM